MRKIVFVGLLVLIMTMITGCATDNTPDQGADEQLQEGIEEDMQQDEAQDPHQEQEQAQNGQQNGQQDAEHDQAGVMTEEQAAEMVRQYLQDANGADGMDQMGGNLVLMIDEETDEHFVVEVADMGQDHDAQDGQDDGMLGKYEVDKQTAEVRMIS